MKHLLANRIDALPLVLAGPIVRHTEANQVSVWLVLRKPRKVRMEIFVGGSIQGGNLLEAEAQTLPMGKNLHMITLTAQDPDPVFQPGETYGYNLSFYEGNAQTETFDEAVDGLHRLVYPPHELPTFLLPPLDIEKVRLLYGSCRKPHGEGIDTLPLADNLIKRACAGEGDRPQQLFLSGDQIYADDVGDALLWVMDDASTYLTGAREKLPGRIKAKYLRPGHRTRTCRKAGFTSRFCKSHAFRLGEYLALYLLVWSDVLWPEELPDFEDIFPAKAFSPPLLRKTSMAFHRRLGIRRGKLQSQFSYEVAQLNSFREGLAAVRRAFANIATYMIFDDHDVTDDWFLNRGWTTRTLRRPLARRFISNGMVAYALCQGWGNSPKRYVEGPESMLLNESSAWVMSGFERKSDDRIQELLGLPYIEDVLGGLDRDPVLTCAWDFRVYGPSYEVWVLDTRTWRGFPGNRPTSIPDLISGEGWSQLAQPARNHNVMTLIIAPTNVIDAPLMAWVSKTAARMMDVYFADYGDSWEAQTGAFEELLARLATLSGPGKNNYVFLSGDVHYAFATRIQYWGQHPYQGLPLEGEADTVLAQLTSSPLCNENNMTRFLHRKGYWPRFPKVTAWAGWNTHPWLSIGSFRGQLKSFYLGFKRRSVRHEPPLLNLENLPRKLEVEQEPDWRYRIDFVKGQCLQGDPNGEGSQIVGVNNLGEIHFSKNGEEVLQTLWVVDADEQPLAFSEFGVPLNHNCPEYPKPLLPGEEK